MLKLQVVLIAVLIGCIGFVACDRVQTALEPVMPDTDDYKSWEHTMLDGPLLEFKGEAHDLGARTIYFNDDGAMANKTGATTYPVGTMIVKESMDPTNTFVSQVSTMMKTDAADNDGWVYSVSGMPVSAAGDLAIPNQLTAEMGAGCHGCHANASNDFVFVSLGDGAGN